LDDTLNKLAHNNLTIKNYFVSAFIQNKKVKNLDFKIKIVFKNGQDQ